MTRATPHHIAVQVVEAIKAGETKPVEIGRRLGLDRKAVRQIAARAGLPIVGARARPAPADFSERAEVMTNAALARHYRTSWYRVAEWRIELGTGPGPDYDPAENSRKAVARRRVLQSSRPSVAKPKHGPGFPAAKTIPIFRDLSLAGRAADECLRRFGPVYRCTVSGAAEAKGAHWRVGRLVLTADQVVERARAKGWDSEAWRRAL